MPWWRNGRCVSNYRESDSLASHTLESCEAMTSGVRGESFRYKKNYMPWWRNGRRGGLKILCLRVCGFDPRLGHQSKSNNSRENVGFCLLCEPLGCGDRNCSHTVDSENSEETGRKSLEWDFLWQSVFWSQAKEKDPRLGHQSTQTDL